MLEIIDQSSMDKGNKRKISYDTLISKIRDPLIPVKLRFIEETVKELNEFLVVFQVSVSMLLWSVPLLENLVRGFAESFILPEILKKASPRYKLSHLHTKYKNIQKGIYEVTVSIDHDLSVLKKEGEIIHSKVNTLKTEA